MLLANKPTLAVFTTDSYRETHTSAAAWCVMCGNVNNFFIPTWNETSELMTCLHCSRTCALSIYDHLTPYHDFFGCNGFHWGPEIRRRTCATSTKLWKPVFTFCRVHKISLKLIPYLNENVKFISVLYGTRMTEEQKRYKEVRVQSLDVL